MTTFMLEPHVIQQALSFFHNKYPPPFKLAPDPSFSADDCYPSFWNILKQLSTTSHNVYSLYCKFPVSSFASASPLSCLCSLSHLFSSTQRPTPPSMPLLCSTSPQECSDLPCLGHPEVGSLVGTLESDTSFRSSQQIFAWKIYEWSNIE